MIKFLQKPFKLLGENVDERYFINNEDGTYSATPLLIYNIVRDAQKYFKAKLFELDTDLQFHSESIREVKDTWTEKLMRDEWRDKYGEKVAQVNKQWYKYRAEHPEEFETRYERVAIGGEDESRFFGSFRPEDMNYGLLATVKAYNAAMELTDAFAKGDSKTPQGQYYDLLPKEEPLFSKAEFAEKHKAFREKLSEDAGIPDDKFEVVKVEKVVNRISNKKCKEVGSDTELIAEFGKQLIQYINSSNAEEFKQKAKEMREYLTSDFIEVFGESNSTMRVTVADEDLIEIHSYKIDFDSGEVLLGNKVMSIEKGKDVDNPDDYIYSVDFIDEDGMKLHYSTPIITKADLKKELIRTIKMLEVGGAFTKYIGKLQDVLETL
jgi:hypothetical protein